MKVESEINFTDELERMSKVLLVSNLLYKLLKNVQS